MKRLLPILLAAVASVSVAAAATGATGAAGDPLYRIADTRPGQVSGEGSQTFGAGWDALTPAGTKIERDGSS